MVVCMFDVVFLLLLIDRLMFLVFVEKKVDPPNSQTQNGRTKTGLNCFKG